MEESQSSSEGQGRSEREGIGKRGTVGREGPAAAAARARRDIPPPFPPPRSLPPLGEKNLNLLCLVTIFILPPPHVGQPAKSPTRREKLRMMTRLLVYVAR